MTQHHYVVIDTNAPGARKKGYPITIGPIEHLKVQVVQHTMEPNQLPVNTEFQVWPLPDSAPASTAKKTGARKASARKTGSQKAATKNTSAKQAAAKPGKRTMSAATKKKISDSQRKRLAAKKANGAKAAS